jgi:hypothetical protein
MHEYHTVYTHPGPITGTYMGVELYAWLNVATSMCALSVVWWAPRRAAERLTPRRYSAGHACLRYGEGGHGGSPNAEAGNREDTSAINVL